MRTLLRWLAIGLGIALAIAIAAPLVLLAIGIRVDVTRFAPVVAERGSAALGRELRLDGPVYVVPSYWPTLEIEDVSIADPYADEGGAEFARLAHARVVISLLAILRGRLALEELSAEGVRLNLVRHADGNASWDFRLAGGEEEAGAERAEGAESEKPPAEPIDEQGTPEGPAPEAPPRERAFEELEELVLRDVAVTWRDEAKGSDERLVLDEIRGAAARGEPLRLSLRGSFRQVPFSVRLGAGHLADLLTARPALPLDVEADLGRAHPAHLEIALQLAALDGLDPQASAEALRAAQAEGSYRLAFSVDRLDALNRALGVALPPLGPLDLRAEATLGHDLWELHTLRLGVGDTRLVGRASVARGAERPRAAFELSATSLRIDDFLAEGWSAATGYEEPEADEDKPEPAAPAPARNDAAAAEPRALLDPAALRLLDARVDVKVDEVVSGDESLGGGVLHAELVDGRFRLDPLRVDLPGGRLELTSSLQVDPGRTLARVAFRTQQLDLGVLARRASPDSKMGGTLDVDMEIAARAPDPSELMPYADGRIDVSFRPENLQAGLIDLWAVNLVAAVLPVVSGSDSQVNCVVGLFDLQDGILTSRSLLIDTGRIQVRGNANADFHSRRVEVLLQPRPKRPQFFSLGTPVSVNGSFEDFGVGVSPLDMVGTVIRVVTDLATFPARLLFVRPLPTDGREACALAASREALAADAP